ncbi:hypothetical protein CBR_g37858 [Chara braunii]|uniref:DUF659 domain-containing protein n=1 Tax=Chara braunii TaxID=69332 RepID=A0A388LNR2_CHABU|nr:hypothetical protein CBR_g37858 [Chara braunii]|eukprot:GBG83986.1 hypothetical protein CBR_g37858 [Chara braunii]
MYDKEKLAEFHDAWLKWIYAKGLAFNAFRGPGFERVRRAAQRLPRTVQFRFPSYRVTVGTGIPSQRGKVVSMVSKVRSAFRHTGATILSDGRTLRNGKPLVNFLAGGANGSLLYATVARDGSVGDTADIVYRRWRAIILSFPAKDVIGFCMDSASNYTAAARRFATDPDADIRRITWLPCSTYVCNLMLSDVGTRVAWVKETIIRARALVQFIKSHSAAFALFRRMSPRVTMVEPVETRFASVFLMLTCLKGRGDALESMLHGDAWARIPWERRLVSQAQSVQQQIHDGEFWRCVDCAIHVMSPIHQLLRRMDREGMMMSIVYEWSQHLLELMRRVDVPADMVEPCMRVVAVRNLHMLEPAHAAAHLLNPRRRSLRYYESLQTATDKARVVEECDTFLLAQTGGDPVGRLYRTQGSVYVLPWVMGTGQEETVGGQEDDEGDVDPEVWGARPAGSFNEHDIERQVVAFHACRPSRADPVQDVFSKRAVELRPWPEQDADGDTSDDEWTDDDDTPVSGDVTTERVYFTYSGGLDGMTPHTSVITDDVSSGGQANGTVRAGGRRRRLPRADVHVEEQEPVGGLRQMGKRWEVRSDSEPEGAEEEEEVRLRDRVEGDDGGEDEKGDGGGEVEDEDEEGSDHNDDHGDDGGDGDEGGDHGDGGDDGDTGDTKATTAATTATTATTTTTTAMRVGWLCTDERRPPGRGISLRRTLWIALDGQVLRSAALEGGSPGRLMAGRAAAVTAADLPDRCLRHPHEARRAAPTRLPLCARCQFPAACRRWCCWRMGSSSLGLGPDEGGLRRREGAFPGRLSPRFQFAASSKGGSGRPSVHIAGRMLGLSRSATRRFFIPPPIPARGTAADMQQGQHYTSHEEGLLMRSGSRRQSAITEVEARIAAELAAGQAALDVFQRQQQTIAAAEAEDEDADTESEPIDIAVRRHRAAVSVAAAVAQAAYISGAQGTGGGGGLRGARGRQSTGRGRGRPSGGRGCGPSAGRGRR